MHVHTHVCTVADNVPFLYITEPDDVTAAREVWAETRDPQKALEVFPKRRNAERCALIGVRTHGPTNPLAAILNVRVGERLAHGCHGSSS